MITIRQPKLVACGTKKRLVATIEIDGNISELWFEVDQRWGDYLCDERSDAFVLAFLRYAMINGHHICSDTPMTEELHYQISSCLIPALVNANHGKIFHTEIKTPIAEVLPKTDASGSVGTGISCGVDSLHVLAEQQDNSHPHLKVDHLLVCNFHGTTNDDSSKMREAMFSALIRRAQRFANANNYKLIVCNTNFDGDCIPGLMFEGATSFALSFAIYAMQKLWSYFYLASGYDFNEFRITQAHLSSPAHYDYLLTNSFSTSGLKIFSEGIAYNRVMKVKNISVYSPSYKYLNVCHGFDGEDGENCSCYCAKCMRTMLELDALGALDNYCEVFDVPYYRLNFHEYLAELYRLCLKRSPYGLELLPYFRHVKAGTKMRASTLVAKKAFLKLCRFGRVSQEFRPH